jgi:hypothetical protein
MALVTTGCWNSRPDLLFVCSDLDCDETSVCPLSGCQSLSSVLSEFTLFCFVFHIRYLDVLYFVWILYHIYVVSASPVLLRRSRLIPFISSYNCCLFIWTILVLTATDHKPFLPRILGFVLSYVASICMFMISYHFLLLPALFCLLTLNIRQFESRV